MVHLFVRGSTVSLMCFQAPLHFLNLMNLLSGSTYNDLYNKSLYSQTILSAYTLLYIFTYIHTCICVCVCASREIMITFVNICVYVKFVPVDIDDRTVYHNLHHLTYSKARQKNPCV